MNNARERMEWFLRFTEMDLSQLRAGDWLNLREDIWLLVHGLPLERVEEQEVSLTQEEEKRLTPETIAFVQSQVKRWIEGIARFQTSFRKEKADWKILFAEPVSGPIRSVSFSTDRSGFPSISVEADNLWDELLFALGATWCGINETELRRCPTCERPFLMDHGRQKFCSFKCKNKEAQRRYRKTRQEQEVIRGRGNYERKIKKKLGPNVQIKRRSSVRQGRKEK